MPLGHLGINVPDLGAAKMYYEQIMPLLGYESGLSVDDQFSYKPAGDRRGAFLFVYSAQQAGDYSRERVGLQHLAFIVDTRSAVRAAHERAAAMDCEIVRPPQEFPEYPPPYFATFWLDPFGLMFEAVCHHDRD